MWTYIHEVADTMSEYINFCKDLCIPKKTITIYPNSNVWFNKAVGTQLMLTAKDSAYKNKDSDPDTETPFMTI